MLENEMGTLIIDHVTHRFPHQRQFLAIGVPCKVHRLDQLALSVIRRDGHTWHRSGMDLPQWRQPMFRGGQVIAIYESGFLAFNQRGARWTPSWLVTLDRPR